MTGSKGSDSRPAGKAGQGTQKGRPAAAGTGKGSDTGSGSLYERYKDALRRGHVAALRGRHDAAIDAYGEAAEIAPDRALPHASIGGILARMDRPADAEVAYERALDLAPRDEAALRGLAEVLTRLGRRAEAAAALDRLSDALDASGRLAVATDTARRALELAESRPRRTHVEELATRLRAESPGDEAAERAIALAMRLLEPAEVAPEPSAAASEVAEPEAAEPEVAEPEMVEAEVVEAEPEAKPVEAGQVEAAPEQVESAVAEAEPEPEPVEPAGLGIALGAAAETRLYAGDGAEAREGLLAAARAHRRAGRLVAAVDACDLAIGVAPADPDLHLLLAELYLDRGWRTLAVDKLLLLGRIAELDADAATRERLCALVTARLPDEPRLAALCA